MIDHSNKRNSKKLAEIYHSIQEAARGVEKVQSQSDDWEMKLELQQAEKTLEHTQKQILEALITDAVLEHQPAQHKEKANRFGLREAVLLIEEVENKAKEMNLSVIVAVHNAAAQPIAVHCMDNAYIASFDIANNKAFTCAALKMSTSELKKLSQPGQSLYGIQFTNQGKIVIFGGGVVLIYNKEIVGALGVSGGTEEQDTMLAEYGGKRLEEVMKW